MGKVITFLQDLFAAAPPPTVRQSADTSYDEVSPEMIRRMNEHAKEDYSKAKWVTETLET